MSRTFVIIKPDAVERGLVGEILGRFERRQLRLVAAELRTIDEATARRHYNEHGGKACFAALVTFLTRGPSLLAIIEGPEDTWKIVRTMMGATNSLEAASGTIRGDLATHGTENLIHGSDSEESAQREIAIFFSDLV